MTGHIDGAAYPSQGAPASRPNRRRIHLAITCHPDTIDRLDALCAKFASTRGRVVDKLVDVLARSYETGQLHCVHGQPCQIGRKDLPSVV